PSINRANEADSGGHVSLGAKCQAPIRSRRRSSGGGGRHNIRRSDHLVDRKSMSQPVASPRTNRSGRTSPPRETLSVRKSRGLGLCFGRCLRPSRPSDRSRGLLAGRQIGSFGLVLARARLNGPDAEGLRPRGIGTVPLSVSCRNDSCVRSLAWARADDVAKRRRQGLVVCRAVSPFRGFFDARPGVTLAPTFSAWVECQSLTVRA